MLKCTLRAFHSPVQLVEIPSGQDTHCIVMLQDVHLKNFNISGQEIHWLRTEQGADVKMWGLIFFLQIQFFYFYFWLFLRFLLCMQERVWPIKCVMACVVTIPIQTLSDLLERLIEGGAAETTLQAITECRSHNFLFRDTFNYPPATTSWHSEQQRR